MTEIASHRGGAGLWPENSVRAFRETLKLGVEQVEFDVQLSADGVPVIFHDATLDRVTDGSGPVVERTLDELERLALFRGGGRIPTLDEAIDIFTGGDIALRCEIKPAPDLLLYLELIEKTVSRVEAAGLLPRTIFTGFHLPSVEAIVTRAAGARDVVWLVAKSVVRLVGTEATCRLATEHGVGSLSMHHTLLDEATLDAVRAHGLGIGTFGVVEEETIGKMLRQGVDVLTTDRPDIALRMRQTFASA